MWYEILPSMGIIVAALSAPPFFTYYLHKFTQNGNAYRRELLPCFNKDLYFRDCRLSPNKTPYVQMGLDNIPDEE